VPLPPVLALSIEDAVLHALEYNRDLRVQRLGPVLAGAFACIERGVFDPEAFAELAHAHERATEVARSTGGQFDVQADETTAAVGVRKRLASGTEVELGITGERNTSNRTPEQQQARLGLTVTQSLLRGRGCAVNLVAVRQAELAARASRYELRAYTETLLAETMIAYWNHVLAQEEIAVFERSLAYARQQLRDVRDSIELGDSPESEAAVPRAEVARREQALIDARSTLRERTLRLLRLVSPSPEGRLDLQVQTTSAPAVDISPIADGDARVLLALRSRPELGEARLRERQARLETVATRNGLLPRLDFFASLGRTGYADDLIDSFGNLAGNTYDLTAGITYSQTLGNRAAKGRHLVARTSRLRAAYALANLEQVVRFDVRLALNEVARTQEQIGASKATRALQQMTVDAERERLQAGEGTALLLAQAERDLLASQIAEVGSVIAYRIALIRLYLAEGTLLERTGIAFS
jgi:outer membrane protein TolC